MGEWSRGEEENGRRGKIQAERLKGVGGEKNGKRKLYCVVF